MNPEETFLAAILNAKSDTVHTSSVHPDVFGKSIHSTVYRAIVSVAAERDDVTELHVHRE